MRQQSKAVILAFGHRKGIVIRSRIDIDATAANQAHHIVVDAIQICIDIIEQRFKRIRLCPVTAIFAALHCMCQRVRIIDVMFMREHIAIVPFGGFGAGANPGVEETEPKIETTAALEETVAPTTEPEETEFVPDEHGTPGLLYEINEDGKSASFIGWGDCTDEKVYVASVYEGLPVTQMVYVEREVANFNDQKSGEDNVSVKHIIISDTVEYVESEALNMCTNLESVHFGASVSEIKGSIYYNNDRGRNFNRITVSPENKFYTEKGNCLIRIKDKVLLCGFANSTIPDDGSVEIIGTVAFFNKPGLTKVVVPEGVIRIMNTAFGENNPGW